MDAFWLPLLVEHLESPDAELREAAARAIGRIGDPRAVAALATAAKDAEPKVRAAAIAALGQIGGQVATKALRALDASASAPDREAIADSLAEAQGGPFPI